MFTYYNANPQGLRKPDCVKRAISVATGMDYKDVERGITGYKKISGADRYNNIDNALGYIFSLGAKQVRLKRGVRTVGDFANAYSRGSYIVDAPTHWTAVVDGVIYDTWDCSNEVIDEGAFLVERVRPMEAMQMSTSGVGDLAKLFAGIDNNHYYLKRNFFSRLRAVRSVLNELHGDFSDKVKIRNRIAELLKYE